LEEWAIPAGQPHIICTTQLSVLEKLLMQIGIYSSALA
jgi:hypothetical protein